MFDVLWAEPAKQSTSELSYSELVFLRRFDVEDKLIHPSLDQTAMANRLCERGYLYRGNKGGAWNTFFGITGKGWNEANG